MKSVEDQYNELIYSLSKLDNSIVEPEEFNLTRSDFKILIDEMEENGLINKGTWFLSGGYHFKGLTFKGKSFIQNLNIEVTEVNTDVVLNPNSHNLMKNEALEIQERTTQSYDFKSEVEASHYIIDNLINAGFPAESLAEEQRLYDTNQRVDISIYHNDQIVAIIEIKKTNNLKNRLSAQFAQQLTSFYFIITLNQQIIPRVFIVFYADDIETFYEFDANGQTITKHNNFPDYQSLLPVENSKIKDQSKYQMQSNAYASFDNDITHENDSLDIDKDVSAFAKLITYKDLSTPLSIGLFGKWGSGKSFFMEKLSTKIDYYSEHQDKNTFCKDIVHVKFNAWHYSDTNLWASLVYKIFQEIDKKINGITDNNSLESQKSTLYKELESSKQAILEKQQEKNKCEVEIADLTKQIVDQEEKIHSNENKLTALELFDYGKEVLQEPEIQSQVQDIKKKLYIENELDFRTIKDTYYELKSLTTILETLFTLFRNDKNFIVYSSIFLGVLFISIAIVNLSNFSMYILLSPLMPAIIFFRDQLKKLAPIKEDLNKLINSWEDIKKQKQDKNHQDILFMKKQQEKLQDELQVVNSHIQKVKDLEEKIKHEIKDIENGKYFREFIQNRISSTDYTQHLGLISLIRDDFTELERFLLSDKNNEKYNIDRIVLYIDDLDRCPDNLVVDVLEAVHLLLAFELFVVIVGVDSRWIQSSLKKKHSNIDDKNITSKQYIEKIFQIPFKIKNLATEDKQNLAKEVLKNNLIDTDTENTTVYHNLRHNPDLEDESIKNIEELTNSLEILTPNLRNIHEKLQLTSEEIKYIEKISNHIGETPRSIKRFINIYRIIRSHDDINILLSESFEDYKMILLLLCETFWKEDNKSDFVEELDSEIKEYYRSFDENKKIKLNEFIERFSFSNEYKLNGKL